MKEKGYIKLYRSIWENPVVGQSPAHVGAFTWLLHRVAWKADTERVKGRTIKVKRGQCCATQREMSKAWGWSRTTVRRYLDQLEDAEIITRKTGPVDGVLIDLITVCNYDTFQVGSDTTPENLALNFQDRATGPVAALNSGPKRGPERGPIGDSVSGCVERENTGSEENRGPKRGPERGPNSDRAGGPTQYEERKNIEQTPVEKSGRGRDEAMSGRAKAAAKLLSAYGELVAEIYGERWRTIPGRADLHAAQVVLNDLRWPHDKAVAFLRDKLGDRLKVKHEKQPPRSFAYWVPAFEQHRWTMEEELAQEGAERREAEWKQTVPTVWCEPERQSFTRLELRDRNVRMFPFIHPETGDWYRPEDLTIEDDNRLRRLCGAKQCEFDWQRNEWQVDLGFEFNRETGLFEAAGNTNVVSMKRARSGA